MIALVGVLGPHKQQHLAMDALARLPSHVVLWFCGDVPDGGDASYPGRLKEQAARLGLGERVKFLGWRDDVPFVLAGADVALLPSRMEAMGIALIEAMALGRPCVGTAVGGIPEVIEDGVTGWVTEADPGAIAGALLKLVTSHELRAEMGEASRRRVQRLFTVERQARQVAEALDAAVSGGWQRDPAWRRELSISDE